MVVFLYLFIFFQVSLSLSASRPIKQAESIKHLGVEGNDQDLKANQVWLVSKDEERE